MLTYRQTLEEWTAFVIKIWIQKMQLYGINNASAQNFTHHIISSAAGDIGRIEFAFNYVLKFTDMAVGKLYYGKERPDGKSVSVRNRISSGRKQKPWYTDTFLLEVRKLANILAANYAHRAVLAIVENIDDKASKHTPSNI